MFDMNGTAKTNRFSDVVIGDAARTRPNLRSIARGWWVTSRMEYLPDALVHVALPLLLVLRHEQWSNQLLVLSLAGLFIWLMGHWVGSSLNCLADYKVDRLDAGHKSRLAGAIDQTGRRPILIVNLIEALMATFVSLWFAVNFDKPALLAFWLAGLLIAYLYSFEPARLKRRNFWNPFALAMIVYATPLLFVYHLLSPVWDGYDVTVLIVYCFQMIPMFLVDEVSDYDEDKATGVKNPCVTYGRAAACWLAITIYIMSCAASLIMFAARISSGSWLSAAAFIASALIYSWVIREFFLLLRFSRAIDSAKSAAVGAELTQELKAFSKTPAWLVATSVGVILLNAMLVYLSR
jgi:4-hydroxybenzoate polyprenyltransferase